MPNSNSCLLVIGVSTALSQIYRGGRRFESTAAHTNSRGSHNAKRRLGRSVPIHVSAMGDPGDEDKVFGVVDRGDDAVIANADGEVIPPGELHRAR